MHYVRSFVRRRDSDQIVRYQVQEQSSTSARLCKVYKSRAVYDASSAARVREGASLVNEKVTASLDGQSTLYVVPAGSVATSKQSNLLISVL